MIDRVCNTSNVLPWPLLKPKFPVDHISHTRKVLDEGGRVKRNISWLPDFIPRCGKCVPEKGRYVFYTVVG